MRPDLANAPDLIHRFQRAFVVTIEWDFWLYWFVVGIAYGILYYYEMRDAKLRAAELERELVQAQLHTLKQQLRPHFLFNTLNTISALVHTDAQAADDMIGNLSSLLRLSLEWGDSQCVSLHDELEALQLYLDLQQTRFGDRFEVSVKIDPAALNALVPHLILQPLVENAFQHALAHRTSRGLLRVEAGVRGSKVFLLVADNGPGSPVKNVSGSGIGLNNTRARLRRLWGRQAELKVNATDAGFSVEVCFPYAGTENDTAWTRAFDLP